MERINAIFISSATCHGQGSCLYRWVSGITKKTLAIIDDAGLSGLPLLVWSHTRYRRQYFKLATRTGGRWRHRQIRDRDYRVVAVVSADEILVTAAAAVRVSVVLDPTKGGEK